ncbi:MAG: DUF4347 domain-containing protein, partial [Comamonas sp.]|nr:DUF4347 domain-containing protein [Comamonas sp.]
MKNEILFLIDNVAGWKTVQAETTDMPVYVLNSQGDALAEMASILSRMKDIDGIHLMGHGANGLVNFGSVNLDSSNINDYRQHLDTIGKALTPEGDFLLYGCNIGASEDGIMFLNQLAEATQADVAASTDLYGGSGNYDLEVSIGKTDIKPIPSLLASPLAYSYQNVRAHLTDLASINFSELELIDLEFLKPLKLTKLSGNNLLDKDLSIYDFMSNIERIAQIEDRFFYATNDTNALFDYIRNNDKGYYDNMIAQVSRLQSEYESVLTRNAPSFLKIAGNSFFDMSTIILEVFEVVGYGLYEKFKLDAHGAANILAHKGEVLRKTDLWDTPKLVNNGSASFIAMSAESIQLLNNALQNLPNLIENITKLFGEDLDFSENSQLITDSITITTKITDDLNQFIEIINDSTELKASPLAMALIKTVGLISNFNNLINEQLAIDNAIDNAGSSGLSALSKAFLLDAQLINKTEWGDWVKDLLSLTIDILDEFTVAGKSPYLGYAALMGEISASLVDAFAITGKNYWKHRADVFEKNSSQLPSVIHKYQEALKTWLSKADAIASGTLDDSGKGSWGINLASTIPSGTKPLADVFSKRYDHLLEIDAIEKGGVITPGNSYLGKFTLLLDKGDWFQVDLLSGDDYSFKLSGGQLSSPELTLYSWTGQLVARTNASISASGLSAIEGTALESGRYYLVATGTGNSEYTVVFDKVFLPASQSELKDAPASIHTPYGIAAGESFHGNINGADNDSLTNNGDWIAVNLTAGTDYRFELTRGTISRADIKLLDALGNLVANPNGSLGSPNTSSVIQGTAAATGTYFIGVNSGGYVGNYTVKYNTVTLPNTLTELKDAPASIHTPYGIAAGESFHGNINNADNDSLTNNGDWIAVNLTAGTDYRFELTRGTISRADIKLLDA